MPQPTDDIDFGSAGSDSDFVEPSAGLKQNGILLTDTPRRQHYNWSLRAIGRHIAALWGDMDTALSNLQGNLNDRFGTAGDEIRTNAESDSTYVIGEAGEAGPQIATNSFNKSEYVVGQQGDGSSGRDFLDTDSCDARYIRGKSGTANAEYQTNAQNALSYQAAAPTAFTGFGIDYITFRASEDTIRNNGLNLTSRLSLLVNGDDYTTISATGGGGHLEWSALDLLDNSITGIKVRFVVTSFAPTSVQVSLGSTAATANRNELRAIGLVDTTGTHVVDSFVTINSNRQFVMFRELMSNSINVQVNMYLIEAYQ